MGGNNITSQPPFPRIRKVIPLSIRPMDIEEFRWTVLRWFERHGRKDLPWQNPKTPYRVWISEIMLQQTRVATVAPYFERFMARFPDVGSLAAAELDEVLALWAGLGYYARARHLHRTAECLVTRHNGQFPAKLDILMRLPGIGRSTAGAIVSLGMGLRAPILDGNLKRVLSRYAALEGWPGAVAIERELWRLSDIYTPDERVGDFNQAMMDLGATVCVKRTPDCDNCPLRTGCLSLRHGLVDAIPAPKPRQSLPIRHRLMLMLENPRGEVYLEKRPPVGLWGGLRSFPEFAADGELEAWCAERGVNTGRLERLPRRRHTFTHFHLDFIPVRVPVDSDDRAVAEPGGHGWFRPDAAGGLPAPVRRLLADIGLLQD